jgi:hypothetical protein
MGGRAPGANDQLAERFAGAVRRDGMMLGILGKTFGKSPMEPYPSSI